MISETGFRNSSSVLYGTVAEAAGHPTGSSKKTFSCGGLFNSVRILDSAPIGVDVNVTKLAACSAARKIPAAMPVDSSAYLRPTTGHVR